MCLSKKHITIEGRKDIAINHVIFHNVIAVFRKADSSGFMHLAGNVNLGFVSVKVDIFYLQIENCLPSAATAIHECEESSVPPSQIRTRIGQFHVGFYFLHGKHCDLILTIILHAKPIVLLVS